MAEAAGPAKEAGKQVARTAAKRAAPARKTTAAAAKKAVVAKKAVATKKTVPATKTVPAKKAAPARTAAPAKKAALAEKAAPVEKAAVAKKAPAAKKPASAKKTAPAKKSAPAKKAAPAKKSGPAPEAVRIPKSESHAALVRRARRINSELAEVYPYAHPELDFENPFELLVATVLSAQTTDLRVNQTTPALFAKFPTPEDMAAADPEELEQILRPTGFFRAKAKSVLGLSTAIRDNFGGEVPGRLEDLVSLPGVGRKTANVVLGNAFGVPGITVDTHFGRLVRRWKWTEQQDPEKVEAEICALFPKSDWTMLSHRVVFHGRRICHARKPACGACPIAPLCPSYGEGETDPEKARKLLKYEKGGRPGQRLKPPADYPGQPAPPMAAG